MNPRPILIATCCVLALVAFVYFFGKQQFSPSVDGNGDRATPQTEPVTVSMEATSKSQSGMPNANTDGSLEKNPNTLPQCPGCGEEFDPAKPGLHNSKMGFCVHTHNGIPCTGPNLWRCQHIHQFSDGTTGEAARHTSMDEAGRYTSGPYKGLTFEQAQKVYQWRVRTGELQDRLIEYSEKSCAIANALVASAEEEMSLILSAFKLLPPDTRQLIRNEAEKRLPTNDVKMFFDDLANHSITMTPDQIAKVETEMRSARKLLWIANDQLSKEFEQIEKEMDEHKRNYPQF